MRLFFEVKSGRLVKTEYRGPMEGMPDKLVKYESIYAEYKSAGKIKYPSKVRMNRDGQKLLEANGRRKNNFTFSMIGAESVYSSNPGWFYVALNTTRPFPNPRSSHLSRSIFVPNEPAREGPSSFSWFEYT